jgi:hypothetical protein
MRGPAPHPLTPTEIDSSRQLREDMSAFRRVAQPLRF